MPTPGSVASVRAEVKSTFALKTLNGRHLGPPDIGLIESFSGVLTPPSAAQSLVPGADLLLIVAKPSSSRFPE